MRHRCNDANAAIVPAGDNGAISVFGTDDTDLVIDINGYFTSNPGAGLSFFTVTPCRALGLRERSGPARRTRSYRHRAARFQYCFEHVRYSTISAGPIAERYGRATGAARVSYVGTRRATLASGFDPEFARRDDCVNAALVPATNGTITAFASNPTDLVVDVNGFFASGDLLPSIIISSLTVGLGQSAPFPVILSAPAPAGGLTVTLTISDPSKATATSSVVVPAGATTPTTQAQVTGVSLGAANHRQQRRGTRRPPEQCK